MRTRSEIDDDELNVQLAQLERVGALTQGLDCSARGMVDVGFREPEDEDERRLFREIFYKYTARARTSGFRSTSSSSRISTGYDPDDLEQQLIEWSLDRLITFSSSRRLRRVQASQSGPHRATLAREAARWAEVATRRLQAR